MKLINEIKAITYKNNSHKTVNEKVIIDKSIKLIVNNKVIKTFSVIDDSLKEFTIGYLFSEDFINSLDDIKELTIANNEINVKITKSKKNIKNSTLKISANELIVNIEKLKNEANLWQLTGGTHVAAIVYNNKFIVKEDVSRHVAVDKVIGYGLLNNFDFSESYIIYSGRMPGDMVIKLTRVGIGILASNAAPTTSGIKIAKENNITLVGFIRGERFNLYTSPERILF